MAIRAGKTRTITVSFPVPFAEQVERIAKAESRTTSELFREAIRRYQVDRLRADLEAFRAAAETKDRNGYGPEDVERLVHEVRQERAAALVAGKK